MKKLISLLFVFIFTIVLAFAAEAKRWMSQPIHVYIPPCGQMSAYMKQAFTTWETSSKSLVRFKFDSSPGSAKIQVKFVDFVTNCSSDHAVGCTHWYMGSTGKFQKAIITIGTKEMVSMRTNGKVIQKPVSRSRDHIYGVMLHEVGHAIGLDHSNDPESIMYPYDLNIMQYLTKEDMRLLYNKYH